jgi:hypothetical protein
MEIHMLTAQEKAAWIKELRDPNNKQCYEMLRGFDGGRCVLGILKEEVFKESYPDPKFQGFFWRDIRTRRLADQLLVLNDKEKKSFPEIADWIEANVETVS